MANKVCTIEDKKGNLKTILKNADLLRDKSGNIIGGIESFYDVTEQEKIKIELKEKMELLERFKDSMVDGIINMKNLQKENRKLKGMIK